MRSYCCFTGTVHSTPANRQTPDEIMDAPDPFGACCGRCLHWGAQCLPSVAHQMCWWIRARPLTQSRCLKALFRLVPACYCNSSLCLALLTLHLLSFSWSLVSCVCAPRLFRLIHGLRMLIHLSCGCNRYLLALQRLLKTFQFHDRLNVITRTLTVAASDLFHFCIIFMSVTCLYVQQA